MHDTWNPWHGCKKISEGCANCYMYFLDQIRAQDSTLILLTNNMKKPLAKNRKGEYKIKSGELIRVCMTSDFFLEEADAWRTSLGYHAYPQRCKIIPTNQTTRTYTLLFTI